MKQAGNNWENWEAKIMSISFNVWGEKKGIEKVELDLDLHRYEDK